MTTTETVTDLELQVTAVRVLEDVIRLEQLGIIKLSDLALTAITQEFLRLEDILLTID